VLYKETTYKKYNKMENIEDLLFSGDYRNIEL